MRTDRSYRRDSTGDVANFVHDWTVAGGLVETPDGVLLVRNSAARWLRGLEHARRCHRRRRCVAARRADARGRGGDRAPRRASGAVRCTKCSAVAPDMGWRMRCEVHLAVAFDGDLRVEDPDGIVVEAAFVPAGECADRLASCAPWVREPLCAWLTERWEPGGRRGYSLRGARHRARLMRVVRTWTRERRLMRDAREHPARRPRRVLRVGRATRRSEPARQAGHRRRYRQSRRRVRRELRGTRSSASTRRCRRRGPARACPHAVFLPPRFERYSEKSREVMAILESVTPLVEQLSIDEAFLDVGGVRRQHGTGEQVAAMLRPRVRGGDGPHRCRSASPRRSSSPSSRAIWRSPTGSSSCAGHRARVPRPAPGHPACGESAPRPSVHSTAWECARSATSRGSPKRCSSRALGSSLGAHLSRSRATTTNATSCPTTTPSRSGRRRPSAPTCTPMRNASASSSGSPTVSTARARAAEYVARTVTLKIRFGDFETRTRAAHAARAPPTSPRRSPTPPACCSRSSTSRRGVRLLGVSLSQPRARGRDPAEPASFDDDADRARTPRTSSALRSTRDRRGARPLRRRRGRIRRPLLDGDRVPMIRVGLVGCGHIGTVHALRDPAAHEGRVDRRGTDRHLRHRRRTRRACGRAVTTRDAARDARRARRVGRRGVGVHVDRRPPRSSRAAAVDAGRAVFCEKPLAPTYADCERVAARCSHGSRTRSASCSGTRRCSPRAAALVASGSYGRPLATTLRDDQYFPIQGLYGSTWRKDVARGRRRHAHRALDPRRRHAPLDPRRSRVRRGAGRPTASVTSASTTSWPLRSPTATDPWPSSPASGIRCCRGSRAGGWRSSSRTRCSGPRTTTSAPPRADQRGDRGHRAPLPEWAGRLQVAEVYAKGLAAYATPTKAFLDALAASGHGAVGHPDAATALASHHLAWPGLRLGGGRWGSGIGGEGR